MRLFRLHACRKSNPVPAEERSHPRGHAEESKLQRTSVRGEREGVPAAVRAERDVTDSFLPQTITRDLRRYRHHRCAGTPFLPSPPLPSAAPLRD